MNNEVDFFRVVEVKNLKTFQKFWPFLCEGLGALNKIATTVAPVDKDMLFQLCIDLVSDHSLGRIVVVMCATSNEPVSYNIVIDNSNKYSRISSALVYAIYSNGKRASASRFGLQHTEKWAREQGFTELHGTPNASQAQQCGCLRPNSDTKSIRCF
jgi:hypothetical protein